MKKHVNLIQLITPTSDRLIFKQRTRLLSGLLTKECKNAYNWFNFNSSYFTKKNNSRISFTSVYKPIHCTVRKKKNNMLFLLMYFLQYCTRMKLIMTSMLRKMTESLFTYVPAQENMNIIMQYIF